MTTSGHPDSPVAISATAIEIAVIIPAFRDPPAVSAAVSALMASEGVALDTLIINNYPADSFARVASESGAANARVIEAGSNTGFTGAINLGIRSSSAPWLYFHNQDLFVTPTHLLELATFLANNPAAAAAAGKILRIEATKPTGRPTFDSAGVFAKRSRACFDRGEGEEDVGQYNRVEEVFALSGAGLMVRRLALEDVSPGANPLDERLFMYKEDIDLAWRLRLRGWGCFYVPGGPAYHVRSSRALAGRSYLRHPVAYLRTSSSRSSLARSNSLRNQWLIILKNESWSELVRDAPWILGREALVLSATLITAPRVAFGAIVSFLRLLPTLRSRRRQVQGRATMTGQELRQWFRS